LSKSAAKKEVLTPINSKIDDFHTRDVGTSRSLPSFFSFFLLFSSSLVQMIIDVELDTINMYFEKSEKNAIAVECLMESDGSNLDPSANLSIGTILCRHIAVNKGREDKSRSRSIHVCKGSVFKGALVG